MKLTDFKKINGKIMVRFISSSLLHSIFHNIGRNFDYPSDILKSHRAKLLNKDELSFLQAAICYNDIIEFKNDDINKKTVQVYTQDKFYVHIIDKNDPDKRQLFEFDEREFTSLAKKYSTSRQIRKVIRELFIDD